MDLTPERLWKELVAAREGILGDIVKAPDEARKIPGMPEEWLAMLSDRNPIDAVIQPWRALPRFSAYLTSALLDVAVSSGIAGPVMVYLLRDWTERGVYGQEPGLMIGGAPATETAVDAFEHEVGRLPASLRHVWLAHAFMSLKNGRWLGSLRPEGEVITRRPRVAGKGQGWIRSEFGRFECLEIIQPGSAVSGCLVRRTAHEDWWDRVVYREFDGTITDSHRPTIEATLTDWDFREWAESDADAQYGEQS